MENTEKAARNLDDMQICRLCLAETTELVNYTDNQELQLLLTTCFAISTEIAGKRPKFVCEICVQFVGRFSEFKQMCMKAESMLANYSDTGTWLNTVEVPEWLRPVQKRRLQQEGAIPPKNSRYETIDVIKLRSVQSTTISSVSAFQYSAKYANTETVIQQKSIQKFQSTTQPYYPQHEPSPAQVTGPQTPLIHLQQVQQTLPLPMQYLSDSFECQVPSHQPSTNQHQQLQSQHRSSSFRQTDTLQPTSRAAFPEQPSLEQNVVVRYTGSSRPILPTPPPVPTTGYPHCTICSLDFTSKDQISQHGKSNHPGMDLTICWCGALLAQLPAVVCHLKQHRETAFCVLCKTGFGTVRDLHSHLDQHLEVGSMGGL